MSGRDSEDCCTESEQSIPMRSKHCCTESEQYIPMCRIAPRRHEISLLHTSPDKFRSPPSQLYNRYCVSIPRIQRSERDLGHPPPYNLQVNHIYSSTLRFVPITSCYEAAFPLVINLYTRNYFTFIDIFKSYVWQQQSSTEGK
jgi:hypothetical protein